MGVLDKRRKENLCSVTSKINNGTYNLNTYFSYDLKSVNLLVYYISIDKKDIINRYLTK